MRNLLELPHFGWDRKKRQLTFKNIKTKIEKPCSKGMICMQNIQNASSKKIKKTRYEKTFFDEILILLFMIKYNKTYYIMKHDKTYHIIKQNLLCTEMIRSYL